MDVRLGGADEGHLPHVGVEAELPAGRELEGLLDAHFREGGQGESEGGGSGQRPESVECMDPPPAFQYAGRWGRFRTLDTAPSPLSS